MNINVKVNRNEIFYSDKPVKEQEVFLIQSKNTRLDYFKVKLS